MGFATGLGVGASLGGLIGGSIKKPEKNQQTTNPNEAAEDDAWYSAFGVRLEDKLFLLEKDRVRVW